MSLPEICIRRPVLSTVISFIILLLGMISYNYLTLRQYPQIDKPVITITTDYQGAGPDVIEVQITKPIENQVSGLEGLDFMTSKSDMGKSQVTLHFEPERDLDEAANDVRDRISRVRDSLPDAIKTPAVVKSDADDEAIIYLALHSETLDPPALRDYANRHLKNQLEALPGVASVDIFGAEGYVMHVWLEPVKLAAFGVTAQDVIKALKQQNILIPAGRLSGDEREFMVTTNARLTSVEDFDQVIVNVNPNSLVRLRDVGYAEFGPNDTRTLARFNGSPAVAIGIHKKSVANPLDIAKTLYGKWDKLTEILPSNISMTVAYDTTVYIQQSLDEVKKTLFEAVLIVLGVIYLFLWSFRASLIPLVTIPVSLVGTFMLMYGLGFSLNTLTLLAFVMAIGLVVDDAIVVLENIYRHIEEGMKPMQAAVKGIREIAFPVIAMTLTLAAVYAPIALAKGRIGKLFTEFAITLAGAVVLSGVIALTLSPMMCARLLRAPDHHKPRIQRGTYKVLSWGALKELFQAISSSVQGGYLVLDRLYENTLKWALHQRTLILSLVGVLALGGALLGYYGLEEELAPKEDQGIIWGFADAPQNASMAYVEKYVEQIDNVLKETPEVAGRLEILGIPQTFSMNNLKPWRERKGTSMETVERLNKKMKHITGVRAYASSGGSPLGSGKAGDSISYVLQTTGSYEDLQRAAYDIYRLLPKGVVENIMIDVDNRAQDYVVRIQRDKAASVGVDISSLGEILDTLISGVRKATEYRFSGEQYDVVIGVKEENKRSPYDVSGIYVRGTKDQMIPISNLVTVKREPVPIQINHYNQLRSVTITGDLGSGISLGKAVKTFEKAAKKVKNDRIRGDFSSNTKQFLEAQKTYVFVFFLALAFIYLIMSAQFESFLDPFIIMFSVPLALVGAVISLKLTGGTMNVFSQIGLVTLIGLITKHGILIVQFANELRVKGVPLGQALVSACALRFRPILMTTAAMVMGALPLALASGPGSEGRRQMGWVIVGGMLIGTFFTLYVVPIIYSILGKYRTFESFHETEKSA